MINTLQLQVIYSGRVALAVSWAKFFTFVRTTPMPRSSDAFNSNIRSL